MEECATLLDEFVHDKMVCLGPELSRNYLSTEIKISTSAYIMDNDR